MTNGEHSPQEHWANQHVIFGPAAAERGSPAALLQERRWAHNPIPYCAAMWESPQSKGESELVIGFASGRIPAIPANLVLLKNCAVVGVYWEGFAKRDPRKNRANFEAMFRWFEAGKLKPPVSKTYSLHDVPQAMNDLLSRKTTGKLVISIR